jgi:hypothetical protein
LEIVYPNGDGKRIRLPDQLPSIMANIKADATSRGYNIMPSRK